MCLYRPRAEQQPSPPPHLANVCATWQLITEWWKLISTLSGRVICTSTSLTHFIGRVSCQWAQCRPDVPRCLSPPLFSSSSSHSPVRSAPTFVMFQLALAMPAHALLKAFVRPLDKCHLQVSIVWRRLRDERRLTPCAPPRTRLPSTVHWSTCVQVSVQTMVSPRVQRRYRLWL